ncbi:class I adenylate-forming enzyme family protein [Blastococcus sp. Marseille-P5729]|uniref:class I adenylate-forming enzyme family protein n=1 Tax=Blastococcus sp. Marseille-P5729 TaxID=2086582 RepID=UPI000D0F6B7A|nr:AMP-binding protein [Blastococcus sp. Marseille-P5729]
MIDSNETARLTALLEEGGATFIEGFDRHAAERPEALAVTYGPTEEQLSFGELARRSDAVAGNLRRRGLDDGDVVSVLATDPFQTTVWMVGIWKAGGIYAPVNFQYAGGLLAYSLNDAKPRLLIVQDELLTRITDIWEGVEQHPNVLVAGAQPGNSPMPVQNAAALDEPCERPRVPIAFDTPASLIYTSGTTGPSKGVVHPHRWINQYTWGLRRRLTTDDVVYNDLPMYHVGGAYANVAAALWAGAGVVLWDRFSPTEFWARIQSGACTTAIILDVMIPWLLANPASADDRRNTLNKAHMQPLPVRHAEFAQRFGIDSVTCGFGQTEGGAPLSMTIEECAPGEGTPDELFRGKSQAQLRADAEAAGLYVTTGEKVTRKAAMGLPGPFFDIAVLDEHDQPCPRGTAGHFALRPKLPYLLFTEYLGKPDKTVEANRNLWFHTGDSAVQDDDGFFYFLDRLGDRIRVRGENVSSVHVEEILSGHDHVDVAAVVAVPSPRSDEDEIVAFIQLRPGIEPDEQTLWEYAEKTMPKFMRPWQYRFVDELPKTPTNKIEKHKLRAAAREEEEQQ